MSERRFTELSVVPSWDRRGGRAIKNVRKARTGWSFWTDHPVCAFKGGFADFLDAQPPPPVPGGDYLQVLFSWMLQEGKSQIV